MNDQALQQLLMDADAAAGTVPLSGGDLGEHVQNHLRRRRRVQVAGVSALLCAMLAIVPLIRTRLEVKPIAKTSVARQELSMVRLQADAQAATVNRLMQYQRTLEIRS